MSTDYKQMNIDLGKIAWVTIIPINDQYQTLSFGLKHTDTDLLSN